MILENSDCTNLSDENYRVNMLVNVKGKRMRASVSYFYMQTVFSADHFSEVNNFGQC